VVCFPAPAITRFPKFVIRLGNLVSETSESKGYWQT